MSWIPLYAFKPLITTWANPTLPAVSASPPHSTTRIAPQMDCVCFECSMRTDPLCLERWRFLEPSCIFTLFSSMRMLPRLSPALHSPPSAAMWDPAALHTNDANSHGPTAYKRHPWIRLHAPFATQRICQLAPHPSLAPGWSTDCKSDCSDAPVLHLVSLPDGTDGTRPSASSPFFPYQKSPIKAAQFLISPFTLSVDPNRPYIPVGIFLCFGGI